MTKLIESALYVPPACFLTISAPLRGICLLLIPKCEGRVGGVVGAEKLNCKN